MDDEAGCVLRDGRNGRGGGDRSPWCRVRSQLRVRSIAGRVFLWLLAVVVLLVAAALWSLILQARHNSVSDAEHRTRTASIALSHAPGAVAALDSPNPSAVLQPLAEEIRKSAGLSYVVFISPQGIVYTDPVASLIGKPVLGPYKAALKGPVTSVLTAGSYGKFVDTTAPAVRRDGSAAGLVSVGVSVGQAGHDATRQLPVLLGGAAAALAVGMGGAGLVRRRLRRETHGLDPAEMTRMYEHHDAVLHAVREGVLIVGRDSDGGARVRLANDEARRLLNLPADVEGRPIAELGLAPDMAELLASGRVASDEVHPVGDRLLAVNNRPTLPFGGAFGSVATIRDTTELRALTGRAEVARSRLQLIYDAGIRVGASLDVARTAQELADVAVPRFADFATVDLAETVLRGDEPSPDSGTFSGSQLRRTAVSGIRDDHPLLPVGSLISCAPVVAQDTGADGGHAVLVARLYEADAWQARHPERSSRVLAYGIHSLISVPLRARGVVLGIADFWRAGRSEAFGAEDVALADELAARASICVDNARRFTREHSVAETLQRSLLPRGLPEHSALDLAFRYQPAQRGVGGDWFDVVSLPGFRVALVVGDVVGHGLHAAAAMGRLRTAVLNFSTLDLPPDELIARLDELATLLETDQGDSDSASVTGATCLYAVYDPVSGDCTMARAGHPPPALVLPDGTVEFPDLPAGLPLGVGALPFETTQLRLKPGSRLVLYTDGLVQDHRRGLEDRTALLRASLAATGTDSSPEQTCRAVFAAMVPSHPGDDIALLVARTHLLNPDQVASWDVPRDPAAVSRIRNACVEQLTRWGLEELSFATELMLSELITNAVRYGTEPIRVRMLRDTSLVSEVWDGSSTAPHLRYADTTDEGGRGLFLVAQLTQRWGTRYTARGKVIWTEQPLTATLAG
ncbi:SpoIIE family protein phosphatase [Streptomyces sp. NPDC004721]